VKGPQLPPARELTYAQYQGWACALCGAPLRDAISLGRATSDLDTAHPLDIEVYGCKPMCDPDVHAGRRTR
jgi:hypothetical protein